MAISALGHAAARPALHSFRPCKRDAASAFTVCAAISWALSSDIYWAVTPLFELCRARGWAIVLDGLVRLVHWCAVHDAPEQEFVDLIHRRDLVALLVVDEVSARCWPSTRPCRDRGIGLDAEHV